LFFKYRVSKKTQKNFIKFEGKTKKELCANFTYPLTWEYLLNDFKDLRVCLAHFCSSCAWERYIDYPDDPDNWFVLIKDMMEKYENLYADVSFTLHEEEYFSLLKVLLAILC
jgi:hypothetical protein